MSPGPVLHSVSLEPRMDLGATSQSTSLPAPSLSGVLHRNTVLRFLLSRRLTCPLLVLSPLDPLPVQKLYGSRKPRAANARPNNFANESEAVVCGSSHHVFIE